MTDMSVNTSDKSNTRQAIFDAAIKVFREKGFQKTRVSDIVSAAGVAQGTFYLYFPSKDEIARQICKGFMVKFQGLLDADSDLFEASSKEELESKIKSIIKGALEVFARDSEAAEIVLREGIGHGGLFKELYEDLIVQFIRLLATRLENSRGRGMIEASDPETAAVFIVGLVERSFFFFMLVLKELDVEKIASDMTDFILNGLSIRK